MRGRLNQLVNDSAEQHRLAFAGIALDPWQTALLVVPPLLEVGVFFEDPVVRVSEEATLILLDAVLVVAGVGRLQVLQTGSVLSIRHASIHLFAAPRWSRETSMSSCALTRRTVESSARILCLQSKFLQLPEDCSQKWPS
jgi:hypothetical protein